MRRKFSFRKLFVSFGFSFLALMIGLSVLYVITVKVIAPQALAEKIHQRVEENCATCDLKIGRIEFHLFQPNIIGFHAVHLSAGHAGGSQYEVDVARVDAVVDLASAWRDYQKNERRIIFQEIEFAQPVVKFVDGDLRSPRSSSKDDENEKPTTFAVLETLLHDGQFTYVRNTKGTSATLHVNDIEGRVGPLGTAMGLDTAVVDARLQARFEKSGHVELAIATLLKNTAHIDVALDVHEQNMSDLTPFFKPNAGVELAGHMILGHSRIEVRERQLLASVWAQYRDLEVKLDSMYDRSSFSAFFMNLGTGIAMNKKNLGRTRQAQTRSVTATREPNEGIVGFILRGMKEAAIHVAEAPDRPENLPRKVTP